MRSAQGHPDQDVGRPLAGGRKQRTELLNRVGHRAPRRGLALANPCAVVGADSRPLRDPRQDETPTLCPASQAVLEHDGRRAATTAVQVQASISDLDQAAEALVRRRPSMSGQPGVGATQP